VVPSSEIKAALKVRFVVVVIGLVLQVKEGAAAEAMVDPLTVRLAAKNTAAEAIAINFFNMMLSFDIQAPLAPSLFLKADLGD
jgi:hypothetical protein